MHAAMRLVERQPIAVEKKNLTRLDVFLLSTNDCCHFLTASLEKSIETCLADV